MLSETSLTNISTHSPLEIASLTAISTWLTKDSPTQHVGRNLTSYFWNLFFRYWLPSVIPSRESASYSETSKSRINACSCIAVISVKWLQYYCFYSNPKMKKLNFPLVFITRFLKPSLCKHFLLLRERRTYRSLSPVFRVLSLWKFLLTDVPILFEEFINPIHLGFGINTRNKQISLNTARYTAFTAQLINANWKTKRKKVRSSFKFLQLDTNWFTVTAHITFISNTDEFKITFR